ncbi:MAG: NTP transferase domain-containing protein, partial [Candidatus Poribacteria bacterium]|nr:NTP transferase domain-containing protein [Candidatus Poribacteria bacterium]
MTAVGIILAAGDGTRMRTKKPKPLHTVAGLSLVAHTAQIMRVGGIEE